METILDFSKDLDVGLFDIIIVALYSGSGGDQQQQAQRVLSQFQEHPDAWTRVPTIMERSSYPQSKFVGLQILEKLIATRWKALPLDQRQGVRNFIVNLNVQIASDEVTARREKTYLGKLNMALVQILKQDWPHSWPTFIPELIQSSQTSLSLCENNMHILRLLSEEIFDYSSEQMTHDKVAKLKAQFASEFSEIFTLCAQVLQEATKPSLVRATLGTLLRFLSWLPVDYMFRSNVVDTLLEKYLEAPPFRNLTIKCLAEMASLDVPPTHTMQITKLFHHVLTHVAHLIPPSTDIAAAYPESSSENQEFILSITLFLTNFLDRHIGLLESSAQPEEVNALQLAHGYLLKISRIDEREIFKICVEYWVGFVESLYLQSVHETALTTGEGIVTPLSPKALITLDAITQAHRDPADRQTAGQLRLKVYADVLSELRLVTIENMAKPEEVLVVENEDGEMVREHVQESDTIALYKSMRQLLVFLTHLGVKETENILTEKLGRQIDGSEWSWNNLNTLCWAVGSISGTMEVEDETAFFIIVIKSLLGLSEMKTGKDDKVVVASAIMYIVGQYPRFLKGHWRFLKTVIQKLFEFMHETHEGVQDMAVDTFMKIAQKCRRTLVTRQPGERRPYIVDILSFLQRVTADLSPAQVYTFYEAVGYIIAALQDQQDRDRAIAQLMELPTAAWASLAQASQDADHVMKLETLQILINVLRSYVAACTSLGEYFGPQLGTIFVDMVGLYRMLGSLIIDLMAKEGDIAAKTPRVRYARSVKREILKLVRTYIQQVDGDADFVSTQMIPPFFDVIVSDYQRNPPATREADVLTVLQVTTTQLSARMTPYVPAIFEGVFEPTLDMIKQDFVEYPEHRLNFFKLLRAIDMHCFSALPKLSPSQFKAFMNSIVWAIKHPGRDVAETGLHLCSELVMNFDRQAEDSICGSFFQQYYLTILQEVFYVLTDAGHQSGFKQQAMLLAFMIHIVETKSIEVPLYDETMPFRDNSEFVKSYIENLLRTAFPHTSRENITTFVANLSQYHSHMDFSQFKTALRDFLIQLKEFAGENSDLFLDEREAELQRKLQAEREAASRIPGMLKPSQLADDDDQQGAFAIDTETDL